MLWDVGSMEKTRASARSKKVAKFAPISVFIIVVLIFVFFLQSFGPTIELEALSEDSPPFPQLEDLIMVAGHAIYLGSDLTKVEQDDDWILESFQKGGQVKTYLKHIQLGMDLAYQKPSSLLVFSGGETRVGAGAMSEAQSYYWLAHKLYTKKAEGEDRIEPFQRSTTEEHAKDSYENLLFSLCRFKEMTGKYPRNLTVVGFEFKRKRFTEIHRFAIRFPLQQFSYFGIDTDGDSSMGEMANSFGPFLEDLYGCHGSLAEKKKLRNPFRQSHGYRSSCPELSALMNYCPEDRTKLFPGKLPWD